METFGADVKNPMTGGILVKAGETMTLERIGNLHACGIISAVNQDGAVIDWTPRESLRYTGFYFLGFFIGFIRPQYEKLETAGRV